MRAIRRLIVVATAASMLAAVGVAVPATAARQSEQCATQISESSAPTLTRNSADNTFTLTLDQLLEDGNLQPAPACPSEYAYTFSHAPTVAGPFADAGTPTFEQHEDGTYHAVWSLTLTAEQVHQTTCLVVLSDWSVEAKGAITDIKSAGRGTVTDFAPTQGDSYTTTTGTNCGSGGSYPW